jgi:hypothetical protein
MTNLFNHRRIEFTETPHTPPETTRDDRSVGNRNNLPFVGSSSEALAFLIVLSSGSASLHAPQ